MKRRTRRWFLQTLGFAGWALVGLRESLAGKAWDRIFDALSAPPCPPIPRSIVLQPATGVIAVEGHAAGLSVARAVGVALRVTDSVAVELRES